MFLQFYGLNEQPFGITPDPRFLYLGPAHQEALASLLYGIETGRGFMALIAPPGLGKTTLILRLMDELQDSSLTAFLFQTHTDSREFLKNLLLDLEAEPTGQDLSDLQAQLRDLLIQGARTGKRLVVVIDEAQNLDDSVLEMVRMLSNFETPEAKLLQIVLSGQPALADKLAQPRMAQLRQRISVITHFPLLRGDEVEKYIQHRLRVAGYKGARLFTTDALALIAKYSGGVPRVINNLCFHALSLGYAKNQKRIDVTTLREVIVDLNLEALGQAQREAVTPAPRVVGVGAGKGGRERAAEPEPAAAGAEVGAVSMGSAGDLLDRVNFSDYTPDWTGGAGNNPRYAAASGAARESKSHHPVKTLAVLAIVAAAVLAWRAPWLGRSLDFLQQELWGATDVNTAQKTPSAVKRPTAALPAQGSRIVETPSTSTPSQALDSDADRGVPIPLAHSSGDAGGPNPTASPASQAGGASVPAALEEAPQTVNNANSQDADSGARTRSGALRKSRATSASGPGANGRTNLRRGIAAPVDDLGAKGERGKLIVQSSVRGARITVNGRDDPNWVTPHLFSLVAGTYLVSVAMQGYSTWTQRVHVDEGRNMWLQAQLANNETGVFTVVTEPPGMKVAVDGRAYGASPVSTVLRAGWHTCEVIPPPDIKPLVGRFHLDPGEALTKRIRIKPSTASSGPISQVQQPKTLP